VKEQQFIVGIKSLEQILYAECTAADMLYFCLVVFMDGFHNLPDKIRRFVAQVGKEMSEP
jgi:hypothetical protein